jgi:type II secretory ATPase GspE/PulE/Tfp pilus assembly ATPase PilB-like protein
MGMDPFNFADALLGILAQRLAKSCATCKASYVPDAEEFDYLPPSMPEELRHSASLEGRLRR